MKKLPVLFLIVVLAISSINVFASNEKKDFLGEWKFESTHAPEGYKSGIFSIFEKEGKLAGEIKFADGYKVEVKDMEVQDGVLKFGIEVDYNYINIKAAVEDSILKGTAASPEGDIPFEARKTKKEDQQNN